MKRQLITLILVVLVMLSVNYVHAHSGSNSYLEISHNSVSQPSQNHSLSAQWKVPLEDLDKALDLDRNGDAALSWQELQLDSSRIRELMLSELIIKLDSQICELEAGQQMLENLSSGLYLVLPLEVLCHAAVANGTFTVEYGFPFLTDASSRTLVNLASGEAAYTSVLSPQQPTAQWQLQSNRDLSPLLSGFWHFLQQGVWHILIGVDHILFLATLLFPVVLRANHSNPSPLSSLAAVLPDTVKVITAFTVAHSITLTLAAGKWVQLPVDFVETSIAVSVVVGAMLALTPAMDRWRWLLALGFGFIHGFGFANVMFDLMLPLVSLGTTIFAFNLGVELGQLFLVMVGLPLLYLLGKKPAVSLLSLRLSMMIVAGLGMVWVSERGASFM